MKNDKKKLIESIAINKNDTGSSGVQIVLLTQKIDKLSKHFKKYKKDKHSSIGLLKAINKRKTLLQYIKKHNLDSYNNILSKLNLRK